MLKKDLSNVKSERDHLQEQQLRLISTNRDFKNKLTRLDKLLEEVSAHKSLVESLNRQVVSTTNLSDELRTENVELRKQVSELEAELQARKVEVH